MTNKAYTFDATASTKIYNGALAGTGKFVDRFTCDAAHAEGCTCVGDYATGLTGKTDLLRLRALIRTAGKFKSEGGGFAAIAAGEKGGQYLTVVNTAGKGEPAKYVLTFTAGKGRGAAKDKVEKALRAYIAACVAESIDLKRATAMLAGEWDEVAKAA